MDHSKARSSWLACDRWSVVIASVSVCPPPPPVKYSYSRMGGRERKWVSGPEFGNVRDDDASCEDTSEPDEEESGENVVLTSVSHCTPPSLSVKYSYSRMGGKERKWVSGPEFGYGNAEVGADDTSCEDASEPDEDESGEEDVGGDPSDEDDDEEVKRQSRLTNGCCCGCCWRRWHAEELMFHK